MLLTMWGGGELDNKWWEPVDGGRDAGLGILEDEGWSWSGGNGYSKLVFTSNGVPTIGVGECNGMLWVRSILGMAAGGGFVRDRLDCWYTRMR
jgi:hypothetical protein